MKFPQLPQISTRNEMRILNWGHVAQITMVLAVIILAFIKIGTGNVRGRGDVWGLSVGIKSLVFYAYMISTEKIEKLRRWYSLKAIMILNCIEVVFWIALIAINCMSVKACSGAGCTVSGLTIMLGFLLAFLAVPVAYVSIRHYSHFKRHGTHPDGDHHLNESKQLPMTSSTSNVHTAK